MEDMRNERTMIVDEAPAPLHHIAPRVRGQLLALKLWIGALFSIAFLAFIGAGIWAIRDRLPLIGYTALGAILVLLVCATIFPVVALLKYTLKPSYRDVDAYGGYFTDTLGRVRPAPPLASTASKMGTSKARVETKVTPVIPALSELIDAGVIAQGHLEMVMGYDLKDLERGALTLVSGAWPGTHAVAGMGRSGKTRRVIANVAQALIAGARVFICDPHATKGDDSLAKALAPLEAYLTIARGQQEIIEVSRMFFDEMEARVSGTSTEVLDQANYRPWLIVYDEWARLMTTNKIEDEERAILVAVAEGCSKEYAGYNGFTCLISQVWTQESAGSTTIRRSLQSVFCHRISPEYAAFFFRSRKHQNRADTLKRRECIYKDIDGEIREIVTIGVPDDACTRIAEYMATIAPPVEKRELPQGRAQNSPQGYGERSTGPIAIPEQRAAHMYQALPEQALYSASASTSAPRSELENVYYMPEAPREAPRGSAQGSKQPEMNTDIYRAALRDMAKRLKNGETPNDIRKSLEVNGGRALQEVNAALNALQEGTIE